MAQDKGWEAVAAELRKYKDAQKEKWGDVDPVVAGRYLAGEANEQERMAVEEAMEKYPAFGQIMALVKSVMDATQEPGKGESSWQQDVSGGRTGRKLT